MEGDAAIPPPPPLAPPMLVVVVVENAAELEMICTRVGESLEFVGVNDVIVHRFLSEESALQFLRLGYTVKTGATGKVSTFKHAASDGGIIPDLIIVDEIVNCPAGQFFKKTTGDLRFEAIVTVCTNYTRKLIQNNNAPLLPLNVMIDYTLTQTLGDAMAKYEQKYNLNNNAENMGRILKILHLSHQFPLEDLGPEA